MQHQKAVALLAAAGLLAPAAARARSRVELVAPKDYRARVVDPHRGRILVVNFWATWCEPCRKEMPALLAVARDLAPRGADFVLVSADFRSASGAVSRYLDGVKARVPAFLEDAPDPAVFIDAVDPKWGGELPHTVVYGRDGKMRLSISETLTEARLRLLLDGVLDGR
jgi:thiol-disulfide isomerase/thioredoxin